MDLPHVLPPNVDAATLDAFFDEIVAAIGSENVSRDPISGALKGPHGQYNYGDAFPLVHDHHPRGAVRPETVDEVQFVVRSANHFRIPLWTVSRGKNLG